MSESFHPESVSDEVLSAFLDGELSPEARLKVERWLEGSASARQRLSELRRISGWVQELPRAELPSDFAAEVMQLAERRMLLPPAVAASRRRALLGQVRYWTLSVGMPVAACLLVAFVWRWQRPEQAPEGRQAVVAHQQHTTDGANAARTEKAADEAGAAAVVTTAPAAKDGDSGPVGNSRVGATSPSEPLPLNGDIDPAQVARVVARIREISDQGMLPVVQAYVVDRREGLALVQVVLESQQILREGPAGTSDKAGNAAARPAGDAQAAGREALFVVTSVEKLTSALEALRTRPAAVTGWKMSEPVDLARLDRDSQQRVEDVLVDLGRRSVAAATRAKQDNSKGPAATEGNGISSAATGESSSKVLAHVPDSPRVIDPNARTDAQLLVTLNDPPRAPAAASSVVDRRTVQTQNKLASRVERAPLVRVLFVLEPAAKDAAPARKTESGEGA